MLSTLKVVSTHKVLFYISFLEKEGISLDDGHFTQFFFCQSPLANVLVGVSVCLGIFYSLLRWSLFLVVFAFISLVHRGKITFLLLYILVK